MKLLVLILTLFISLLSYAQGDTSYLTRFAAEANVKRPISPVFKTRAVRVPIAMDSFSLTRFHTKYIRTMTAGTVLLGSGTLIMVSHIFIAAFAPHFNRNGIISLAAIGVSTMTAGSITLPVGTSYRHRYKKSLRIALAKDGL